LIDYPHCERRCDGHSASAEFDQIARSRLTPHGDLIGTEQAQNNIAAVSAEGSTVWVLIRRLNYS
jgi:hypothetical protein